ncbi:DNA recombination protein RmuC [Mycoplasma sp. SG1]|uniref:DNA recombination protein RmuC n=1 Tax=Mycoplasma sp. SG1 TaxID=2810348 RepID=UPI002023EE01|nr:DNA recombination protein RmuC [Mycoplasma sp. SG1]URM53192.1 DNA recombination protein RmuC [Mycoplasma sp. SG1]
MSTVIYLILGFLATCTIVLLGFLIYILITKRSKSVPYPNQVLNPDSNPLKDEMNLLKEQYKNQYEAMSDLIKNNATLEAHITTLLNNDKNVSKTLTELSTKTEQSFQQINTDKLKPILENFQSVSKKFIEEDEKTKTLVQKYQEISNSLINVKDSLQQFEKNSLSDTKKLVTIFLDKKARGTYGEISLNLILTNIFGENEYIWEKQKQLSDKSRPDVIFKLKNNENDKQFVAIDSKFPCENFQKLQTAETELEKKRFSKELKEDIKAHIKNVKKYINKDHISHVLIFIPSELIFAELCNNPEINPVFQKSFKENIWILSPTTLALTLFWLSKLANEQRLSQILTKNFDFIKNKIQEGIKLAEAFEKDFDKVIDNADKLGNDLRKIKKTEGKFAEVLVKIQNKSLIIDDEKLKLSKTLEKKNILDSKDNPVPENDSEEIDNNLPGLNN